MWVARAVIIAYADKRGPIPNADTDRRRWQSSSRIDFAPPMCALPHSTPDAGGPISRFSGASPDEPKTEPEGSIMSPMGPEMLSDTTKGQVMGKREGKIAVITGGSSGMALASAKRFVEEGAYVFITGRRQEALDEAVKLIGRNRPISTTSTACSIQSSGKRAGSTSCTQAPARAKPSHWARLPSTTSIRPSA